jgi:CubicO group peptidase (beta-lactamase class C family)
MLSPCLSPLSLCRICVKQEPKELSKTLFWGLGWGIQREHKGVLLWHWGDNSVFKAFVMADPARKSGVVMFANGEDAAEHRKADHRHSNGHRFPGIRLAQMKHPG